MSPQPDDNEPPSQISSSQLILEGEPTTNTAATPRIYAIIGSGFAAIVNQATLRWSQWGQERLKSTKIVHVHEGDPWLEYVDHYMGQWPDLLTLPGYEEQTQYMNDPYLLSKEFARMNNSEWDRLSRHIPKPQYVEGRVTKIVKERKLYKISVSTAGGTQSLEVNAHYVDVCSGPGYMKMAEETTDPKIAYNFEKRGILIDAKLMEEYKAPKTVHKRRVVGAQLFMHPDISKYAEGKVVCVSGSGALASSCVERALSAGCKAVYWMTRYTINLSLTPSHRYDKFAKMEDGKPVRRRVGLLPDDEYLFPADKRVKFAEGYKVAEVRVHGPTKAHAQIKFAKGKPGKRSKHRYVDLDEPRKKEIDAVTIDILVISAGSQVAANEEGSAAYLVRDVRKSEKGKKLTPLKPDDKRVKSPALKSVTVGLRTKDETLRVLGAASTNHEDLQDEIKDEKNPRGLTSYHNSLPDQARVALVGITFSAVRIAHANGFFFKNVNDCVNTAHKGELWSLYGVENGLTIYRARRQRADPFTIKNVSPDDEKYPPPKVPGKPHRYRLPKEYWK